MPSDTTASELCLRIYVSKHCSGYGGALDVAERVRENARGWRVVVIDIDEAASDIPNESLDSDIVPSYVVGTPMYLVNHQVVSWGNPLESDLIEKLLRIERMRSHDTQ